MTQNSLLGNAKLSIKIGLEDYTSKEDGRAISSARNLYAGALLLCKEVLSCRSPKGSNNVLIMRDKKFTKDKDGDLKIVGVGKRTIGRQEIEKTFDDLQIEIDLSKLRRLAKIRNDIEHHFTEEPAALIREAVAEAMPLIRDLIDKGLKRKPRKFLGQKTWELLLKEARVFKEEQDRCRQSYAELEKTSAALSKAVGNLSCPHCSSSLLENEDTNAAMLEDIDLICSQCGKKLEEPVAVFEAALDNAFAGEAHITVKEGGELPIQTCPECEGEMYVIDENRCVNCGFTLNGIECSRCEGQLTLDDLYYRYDSTLCSYCEHISSKDD